MKKLIVIVVGIMVALAVLLPFASKAPDGLQSLVASSGDQQQQQLPVWNGIMASYSAAIEDPYISTLIAGFFGTSMVLIATFALGTTLTQKKKNEKPRKSSL